MPEVRRSGIYPTLHVPTALLPPLDAAGATHVGMCRRRNEDAYLALPSHGLFCVADGMGGAACGDVASALVGEVVRQVFEEAGIAWLAEAGSPLGHRGEALLVASVGQANERIRLAAQADPNKVGMGSTFAGALFGGDRVVLAHVGDSRIYRLRGRHLELLTHDHLVVNELVNAGVLSRDEAGKSEYRNMLSRAVGTENVLEVETRVEELARDDLYLICSDGLHGVVQDGAISKILLEQRDLTKAVEELIRCANGAGGPDNITALLIRIG